MLKVDSDRAPLYVTAARIMLPRCPCSFAVSVSATVPLPSSVRRSTCAESAPAASRIT